MCFWGPIAMLKRAYSTLTVKSIDEDQRIIRGMASTPTPDRMDDIVDPMGAKFASELVLLLNHNSDQPVGSVVFGKPTKAGIPFEASIPNVTEEGELKKRTDEAWQSVKYKIIRSVSIGFRVLNNAIERLKSGGVKFLETEIMELSLVAIPANPEATIQQIKSYDRQLLAASGTKAVVRLSPGDSGRTTKPTPKPAEGNKMKTVAERIQAFTAEREIKSARMTSIMDEADAEGSTLNAEQEEEFETLQAEVKSIDGHLSRLGTMQDIAAKAVPVSKTPRVNDGSESRLGNPNLVVKGKPEHAKGLGFTRMTMALIQAQGNKFSAIEVAKNLWGDSHPEVELALKAAVAPGNTTDATWAGPLAARQNLTNEFVELLRPETLLGKLSLRRVPFNVRIPGTTQGSTIGWVGQGAPKPVSAMGFADITLDINKVAGIVVITEELARLSNPAAEGLIQADMIAQTAQFLDESFIDPASTAISGVRPASITNGAHAIASSGPTGADLRADVKAAYAYWIASNQNSTGAAWITTPTLAMSIGLIQNPLGQPEFPNIGANGGTLLGLPVYVSNSVPADTAGALLVLVKQSEILLADDGGVTIDVSREASLQMNTTPDNPATAATVMTSLWQQNLVGIRAERYITWARRRPQAVVYITGANYAE